MNVLFAQVARPACFAVASISGVNLTAVGAVQAGVAGTRINFDFAVDARIATFALTPISRPFSQTSFIDRAVTMDTWVGIAVWQSRADP